MMQRYDAIVVGAGVAGLGVGALLARDGLRVVVLEREPVVGGRSASFAFGGYTIDIGLHTVASASSSGIGGLLEEVGAELELVPVKPALMHFDLETRAYTRATAPARFGEKLYEDFKGLVKHIARMDRQEIEGFHGVSAETWILERFDNPELVEFFKKITGFAGKPMDEVSAGAFIETLHDSFTSVSTISYPARGGIKALSDVLEAAIRRKGGEVLTGVHAERLLVEKDAVQGVAGKIVRPSYIAAMTFAAPRVVYTAPLVSLPRWMPEDRIPAGMQAKIEKIRAAAYNYNGIVVGARAGLMDGFTDEQFFQWTFDRPGMDWHGIVTVPTYVDPGLAPEGRHLLFVDCHVPMPAGRSDLARERQRELVDICREIWPDFDAQVEWIQYLIYPDILPLAQTGLTGPHRPGFSVPGTEGLYLAGDATYLTGSGIGSATKSAIRCARAILGKA